MNDHTPHDPQLQSIEARLAAAVPQVSPSVQQQLLYQCAFAAGQQVSRRSLRRWQAFAAVLGILLVGLGFPLAQDRMQLAEKTAEPARPAAAGPPSMPAPHEFPLAARQAVPVELDAWQIRPADQASLPAELAQFERIDPHLRSLAVGTLSRTVLKP